MFVRSICSANSTATVEDAPSTIESARCKDDPSIESRCKDASIEPRCKDDSPSSIEHARCKDGSSSIEPRCKDSPSSIEHALAGTALLEVVVVAGAFMVAITGRSGRSRGCGVMENACILCFIRCCSNKCCCSSNKCRCCCSNKCRRRCSNKRRCCSNKCRGCCSGSSCCSD